MGSYGRRCSTGSIGVCRAASTVIRFEDGTEDEYPDYTLFPVLFAHEDEAVAVWRCRQLRAIGDCG